MFFYQTSNFEAAEAVTISSLSLKSNHRKQI